MVRVAIAAFMQESNSFAPRPATLEVFEAAGIARGEAIVERFAGTNSELGGFLAALEEASAEPVPLLAAHAISGGPLTRHTYETLLGELLERLRAAQARAPLDGVLLALHGAMLAEGDDDADGTTLARVREAIGLEVPLVASLDLHANVTARMVRHATALAGYNTYPHGDQPARGASAAGGAARRTGASGPLLGANGRAGGDHADDAWPAGRGLCAGIPHGGGRAGSGCLCLCCSALARRAGTGLRRRRRRCGRQPGR